jgi:hypothetical protein
MQSELVTNNVPMTNYYSEDAKPLSAIGTAEDMIIINMGT